MLDTVLKIGKAFRESPNGLKHHSFIKPCPQDTDKRRILRLSIPVNRNYKFNLDGISEITDENLIKNKLFYLTFKTSKADGLVKYIFGDIYYALTKGTEHGFYRLANKNNKQKAYQVSSFIRGKKDFNSIKQIYETKLEKYEFSEAEIVQKKENFAISVFRTEFEKNITLIERILKYQCGICEYLDNKRDSDNRTLIEVISNEEELKILTAKQVFKTIKQGRTAKKVFKKLFDDEVIEWGDTEIDSDSIDKLVDFSIGELFLHLDFEGKHWHEFKDEIDIVNQKLLEDFVEQSQEVEGFVLKKFLYKTLGAGNYKAKNFKDTNEVLDLLYAVDYSKRPLFSIPSTDIKVIVLPRGDNLIADHYLKFQDKSKSFNKESISENQINVDNQVDGSEFIFSKIIEGADSDIVQFDLIFSKKGSLTSPDVDLVEISAIDKSYIKQQVSTRIDKIKNDLYNKLAYENIKKSLSIIYSFKNILKSPASGVKKYKNHLLKVLPQIYTGTYYRDPILLPALIEKIQFEIRHAKKSEFNYRMFKEIKYDYYFLTIIQNVEPEGGNLMKIKESQSYKIGRLLGKLAQNFSGRKSPIKSFEKSYVGNLSRRITTLEDLIKFKTFIEEKIAIHEMNYENNRIASVELAQLVKKFAGRYDKNVCAFGFFESYYSPFVHNKDNDLNNLEVKENQKV